jgi:hypothetical protein
MLLWYVASAVAAIVVGWVAAMIHASGHAPIGIVSILVGLVLGAALAGVAAVQHIGVARQLIIGSVLIAIITALAEHAWLYIDFRRQWHESRTNAQVAVFRPELPPTPAEYFSSELTPQSATLWCFDAMMITASAAATVYLIRRGTTPRPSDKTSANS